MILLLDPCASGKFYESSTRTCDNCNSACDSCFGGSSSECTRCAEGVYLKGSECHASCPSGWYGHSGDMVCRDYCPE
jgi:hypothetical protein